MVYSQCLALALALSTPTLAQVEDIGAESPVIFLISGNGQAGLGHLQPSATADGRAHLWTRTGGVEILGNPLSEFTSASDVSDDGTVACGSATFSFDQPLGLLWDAAGSVTELTPAGSSASSPFRVSGDGSVIAGIHRPLGGNWHACVWDAAGTLTDIHPSFGSSYSTMRDLSHDGSTVLGSTTDPVSGNRYFLWTAATGSVQLPPGPSGIIPSRISADGSAVVGRVSLGAVGDYAVFYWSAATGYIVDDPALGEPTDVRISGDGNRVFGLVETNPANRHAAVFTWTPAVGFSFDPADMEVDLYDSSYDGSVLVGAMGIGNAKRACKWTDSGSFVELTTPTARSFASSVSLDGTVIAGTTFDNGLDRRSVVWTEDGSIGSSYCGPAVPNSTGTGGKMQLFGSNVTSVGSMTLTASDLPQSTFGFFVGSEQPGLVTGPGGSLGNLCLSGRLIRFVGPGQVFNTGTAGSGSITIDPSSFNGPSGPILPQFGGQMYFQAWFRDANPTVGSNFTDGATVALF